MILVFHIHEISLKCNMCTICVSLFNSSLKIEAGFFVMLQKQMQKIFPVALDREEKV